VGFTGRYRLAVAVVTIAVLVFMPTMPARGLEHATPWALVGSDFAYERYDFPVVALLVAVFASLVWISVAFALGAGFGGHLGPALAQRMSSRERTVIISLLIAIAIIRFTYDENRKHNHPLQFPGAVEIVSLRTRVVVASAVGDLLPDEQAAMERVAQWISGDLDRLATYLDCEDLPPVHLVHRRNMLPHEISPGDIVSRAGRDAEVGSASAGRRGRGTPSTRDSGSTPGPEPRAAGARADVMGAGRVRVLVARKRLPVPIPPAPPPGIAAGQIWKSLIVTTWMPG
jgi:hypothetical protein